jgi:hypothetical protein
MTAIRAAQSDIHPPLRSSGTHIIKVTAVLSCCVAHSGLSLTSQDDVLAPSSRRKMFDMSLEDRTNTSSTNISNKLSYAVQQPRRAKDCIRPYLHNQYNVWSSHVTRNACVLLNSLENC